MYDKCYFCLDQLPKLKKESTTSFFVNFGRSRGTKEPTYITVIWPLNNNREHLIRKLLILAPIWFVIVSRVMSASRSDINRPKCDGKKMVLQPEGTEGSVLIETVNRGYHQFNQNLPNLAKMTDPPPPKKKKGGVKVWPILHLHRPARALAVTATRMEINYRIVLIIEP